VVELVKQTGSKLLRNDLDGLWIPTHFMHDAENDDLLCWLLLEWLRRKCGTPLSVLVQLPTANAIDVIQDQMEKIPNVTVFRDPGSMNEGAVRNTFRWKYAEL